MRLNVSEEALGLLDGSMDLHVHTAPDLFPRRLDDKEAALQAQEAGLTALVLKSHFFPTMDRAQAGKENTGFDLIGSITLNKPVGGMNAYAVETAVKQGARIVWMPTVHSVNTVTTPDVVDMFQEIMKPGEKGLPLMGEEGLLDEVHEVLEIIREKDVTLATGHVSPPEAAALVKEAVAKGLKKIVLTHPLSSIVGMSLDQVKTLTELSKQVYVEFTCFDCCEHVRHPLREEQVAGAISEIGPEQVILTSDGGQKYNPYPVEMLANMIEKLAAHLDRGALRTMLVRNPSYLMG